MFQTSYCFQKLYLIVPQISEKTKEKVREVITRLNYKPNAIARSLANKKTRIIGVVLPSEAQDLFFNPFS